MLVKDAVVMLEMRPHVSECQFLSYKVRLHAHCCWLHQLHTKVYAGLYQP